MLFSKLKRDKGDSTLVSTIIVIPLVIAILITIIDTSIFFSNRAFLVNATRDAARTVSIFGGDGNATVETPLERAYGSTIDPCAGNLRNLQVIDTAYDPYVASSDIECQLMTNLASSAGLVNVKVKDVQCGPGISTFIGQQAFCEIAWTYDGVPGSGLTLLRSAGNNMQASEGNGLGTDKGLDGVQRTRVTTTTEVNMSGIQCRNRTSGAVAACPTS